MLRGLGWLRDAEWLTPKRALVYGLLLAVLPGAYLVAAVLRLWEATGLAPGGSDFVSFYTASSLVLQGETTAPWDVARHADAQGGIFGRDYFAFFYPPNFLLICWPLALLPYVPAVFVWLGATAAACIAALSGYRAAPWPAIAALVLLAPAAVQNVANGQNAFLVTALFAATGLVMDRRPWLAGMLLAVVAFKPQFGLLVLPALLAAGRWRVLAWGGVGAALLFGATVAAFGVAVWPAFLATMPAATTALAEGLVPLWQMQSVFASLRTLGFDDGAAYAGQAVVAAMAVIAVMAASRHRPGGRAEIAAMAAGAPLATPFVLAYDLTLLLLPAVWLCAEARRGGFLGWEKAGLVLILIAPGASIAAGLAWRFSLGPIPALVAFALVLRRIHTMARTHAAPA